MKMLSGCGSKWGEEKEEGVGFCSGLVLYVWHFLQTICTNLSKEGSHIGILRFYFLFLYLSAITWLYCNLLVMIIELVFHKTIHMLFTLTCVLLFHIIYICEGKSNVEDHCPEILLMWKLICREQFVDNDQFVVPSCEPLDFWTISF